MTRRIFAALGNLLRDDYAERRVHFHSGAYGHPTVCHNPGCGSPHLAVER